MRLLILLTGGMLVVAWSVRDGAAHPGTSGVTWNGSISRIFERRCVECHNAMGISPRLDDLESARPAAAAVKEAVLTRRMPRWDAVAGFGAYLNDPTLTNYEIEQIADWIDDGMPAGTGAPARPVRGAANDRASPAIVLRVPAKYAIREASHTFTLPTQYDHDQWIRAWTVKTANPSHARGAVLRLASGAMLGTWVPGDDIVMLPDGVAQRLPAGSTMVLTMYYADPQGPASDAPALELYFARTAVRELMSMELPCGATTLPQAMDALAIRPAVGSAGRALAVIARTRGGRATSLGAFKNYSNDHPQTYWFRDVVSLPRGTTLNVTAVHGECAAAIAYVAPGARIGVRASAADSEGPAASGFWCPMHHAVHSETAGSCPICRMALVPVIPRVEGAYPVAVRRAGHDLELHVSEPGTRAPVARFEMVHERPFHLFAVSNDLQSFAHVHPELRSDGLLRVPAPFAGGGYQLYADFLPGDGTPQMVRAPLISSHTDAREASRHAALTSEARETTVEGVSVRLEPEAGEIVAGEVSLLDLVVTNAADGSAASDLEPYLGAWGHLFVLSADLEVAMHSHPIEPTGSSVGERIVFRQRFPKAGVYRIWAQIQRTGRVLTVPFTVTAKASS